MTKALVDVTENRFEVLKGQARMIREVREVQFFICSEKEQVALASWSARISRRTLLTPKQLIWLEGMYRRACAYDERGGRD